MPFNMSAAASKQLTTDTIIDFGALGKLSVTYRPNMVDKAEIKKRAQAEKDAEAEDRSAQVNYFISVVAKWDATYADGTVIPLTEEALTKAFDTEDVSQAMLENILMAVAQEAMVGEGKGTRLRKL